MEGTNAEPDDPPKDEKGGNQKQGEKGAATKNPSPRRKISKLSLSKTQHYINEQKRLMEQEEETGGIDECYEIAGESIGLIPSAQKVDRTSAKDDFDYESDEDVSDTNEGKIECSQNSGSARQRVNRDFVRIAKVSLKIKPDEQKSAILRIFRTKMNKSGVSFDKTDPGNWEDCTKLGGWTRTHVRIYIYIFLLIRVFYRLDQFNFDMFCYCNSDSVNGICI